MKHIDEFTRFLTEEVDLNKARIKTLTDRVGRIEAFLEAGGWRPEIIGFSRQGSWAHKTIIKPPRNQGFDADVLVFVNPVDGWSAKDYVHGLKETFKGSGTYKDKAHLHTRCVRLEYAGDFQIDVVPCVVYRPGGAHQFEVCNRIDDEFEVTDGEAYTRWLEQRNTWTGLDKLREVTRLLKYLRDIKGTFSCKSILLTTLLGERIESIDEFQQASEFPDLPTALKTIMGRLDDYLQARPHLHDVCNPVLPQENFNRHWDQDKYSNFRDMVHKYRGWIDEAYAEADGAKSITKWQRVFGDDWGKSLKKDALMTESSVPDVAADTSKYTDLVQAVSSLGPAIVSSISTALSWVKPPPWQNTSRPLGVQIKATLHNGEGAPSIGELYSGQVIPKHKSILLQALTSTGMPYGSRDYQVHWQVVNTDRDAAEAGALRGGFYRSDSRGRRCEATLYRGVHWVQAFVVRRRDGRCVGISDRYFVVIE